MSNVGKMSQVLNAYPVGSIYMSVNSTNPGELFGGTWEQIQGRFLLGQGSGYSAGTVGGEANHALSDREMPSHRHIVSILAKGYSGWGSDGLNNYEYSTTSWANPPGYGGNHDNTTHVTMGVTSNTGDTAAHNNMPPYLVVYIWKRTA